MPPPVLRRLGRVPYAQTFAAMRDFTHVRTPQTPDELWFLEHPPVFTQGQAGRAEHLLAPGDIPVVHADRGGQVTYHGPGQLVVYVLLDLHRLGYGIRSLVTRLEQSVIDLLSAHGIAARARGDAPGVYVARDDWPDAPHTDLRKIASLGLRVSRGCSYHGLALNVDMDLSPFARIDPCGMAGLRMTQLAELGGKRSVIEATRELQPRLLNHLGLSTPLQ